MLRGRMPSRKLFGRIGLFFVIGAIFITITAAGTNAAAFSFIDSVREFLGFAPIVQTAAPISAPARGGDAPSVTGDLFFSEYIEGTSSNKAVEIYNGTGASVDLGAGGYVVEVYSNGSSTAGSTINLSGTIVDGDVFVLANNLANAAILAQADDSTSLLNFNGDDAVRLRKGATTTLDVIGQIGFDPGTEWGSGVQSTADNTIRRMSSVCAGDTDGSNAFSPALEWDGFAVDVTGGLGSHTAPCISTYTLSVGRAGTGSGQVTSNPPGISCGVDCTEVYDENTVVTLTAVPDAGSSFAGWTGEPCAGLPENCDVTMTQARSVTVNFDLAPTPTNTATATSTATATPVSPPTTCFAPDNGTGTADLPAPCRYFGGPLYIDNQPPPGQTITAVGSMQNPTNVVRSPGGSLGGEVITSNQQFVLAITTGTPIPKFLDVMGVSHTAPRTPGNPVQSFDTEMFAMQGQLPPGDPDFDLLRITAGSSFGLPSPGHTTLTQMPGGNWAVDSFFDITYRIDYVGKPGGPFSGMSGSTTGTIRMAQVSGPRQSSSCVRTDNGAGTIDLPAGCPIHGWPMSVENGLPADTTLQMDAFFDVFYDFVRMPGGGGLGGERDEFKGTMTLNMCGTGMMTGYCRSVAIPISQAVMDSAPRAPGNPVQSFDTDMFVMQGQLPPGDPDFDLLRITGGTGFGMPSPGHTTLTRQGAGPNWNVDSFFDITYRIDFVGKPGSPFSGMSGSTTGTIRMNQGVFVNPPTPTATNTPTPTPRSITVLKLNHVTGDPLPGWTMRLHAGLGCTGPVLDTQVTGPDGLADFVGLSAVDYSVEEEMQLGWTPYQSSCADGSTAQWPLAGGSGPATGEYPGMGDDTFASGAHMTLEIQGMPTQHVTSNGPTVVHRSEPCSSTGTCTGGLDSFDTEMLSMDLHGSSSLFGPFMIRESPTRASTGRTTARTPGADFPADSFFDVFFEIDTQMGTLHNENPLHVSSMIEALPPLFDLYRSPPGMPIPLLDSSNQPVGVIRDVVHIPLPPGEILIVFRNIPPPATPTFTPTPSRSITVVKLNHATDDPLPGWTMNLHSGLGCTGPVLDTQDTDADGLADFVGLTNGDYSVAEVMQGGWTPATPVCQDVSLSGPGGGGGGGAGGFTWASGVHMTLELQGMPISHITGNGDTVVQRSSTCPGCGPGGRDYFDTEMLSMDLQGSSSVIGPFMIRESPTRASTGRVMQQTPGVDYPADSFFDVFFEIDTVMGPLHTAQPSRCDASVFGFDPVPIQSALYRCPSSLPLLDAAEQPVGFLHRPLWVPMPPGEILIVFRNQPPPPTATNTATATPTATNTPSTCIAPDNGSNTVDLPAPCRFFGGPMSIINGLPPGEPVVDFTVSLDTFTNVVRTPGGPLGGEEDSTSASLTLRHKGWDGTIKGRPFTAEARFSHGPRQTTSFTQDFPSELSRLIGQLPPGDPDFDLLRVTAGSDFGLPSPGHTTLIRESPTLPRWSVDSFFDITYRIDFVGKPGGHYGGMSGSTTGTIRVYQNSSGPRPPEQCLQNDNGSGTVDTPAPCPYSGWPISAFDGMPPGTSIQADMLFDGLANVVTLPGGPPGGQRKGYDYYQARSDLQSTGAQTNPAFHRSITFQSCSVVVDFAPGQPGQPVQSFDTEMISLQCQLPPGDPDFDLLRITAGSDFGLPSPGHTTLIRESPTLPHRYYVDSFFDITYRIDFVGSPGGQFAGRSGSTTATIRMQQGIPGAGATPTATATATYTPTPNYNTQPGTNVVVHSAASDASASFSVVTGAGDTTFTPIAPNSAGVPPPGRTICATCPAYDITTTALYSPPIEVCFVIPESVPSSSVPKMRLLHGESGTLVDITTCNMSPAPCQAREVCGETDHLSPFVMAEAAAITGTVTYGNPVTGPNPRGVPNVLLSGAGSPAASDTTGAPGTYLLTGFGAGSYTITPSKSGGVNGAVTSFDAANIAQYVTGNASFTAAQFTVADVTGAGGVSSYDAALIARYAAALGAPTGNSGTWIFSPTSNFHATVTADVTGEDYSGLLMGDVSGNWGDPSPFRPAIGGGGPERQAAVNAPMLVTPADNEVIVPVSVQGASNKGVISYEFDLRYDPSVIQPQPDPVEAAGTLSNGLSTVVNAETPGLLRVVAYGPMPIEGSGLLLNLKFTAVGAPASVSPLTWERFMLNEGSPRLTVADGQVELSAAPANQAEISGRLLTSFGVGVPNSRVTLTDSTGQSRTVMSNGFGNFRFGGLQVGQTYTIRAEARSFAFAPMTLSVVGQSASVDLIAAQ